MTADKNQPAGGVELYRSLVALADEYRMKAVAERDYDCGAIALALHALILQAARAGLHVHMTVHHDEDGGT